MEIPPYEESKDVVQRKLDQTTMILQNINAYFLLIDKDFIVCDTNYYSLNKLPAPEVGMTQRSVTCCIAGMLPKPANVVCISSVNFVVSARLLEELFIRKRVSKSKCFYESSE